MLKNERSEENLTSTSSVTAFRQATAISQAQQPQRLDYNKKGLPFSEQPFQNKLIIFIPLLTSAQKMNLQCKHVQSKLQLQGDLFQHYQKFLFADLIQFFQLHLKY